jgi:hypothetical protein
MPLTHEPPPNSLPETPFPTVKATRVRLKNAFATLRREGIFLPIRFARAFRTIPGSTILPFKKVNFNLIPVAPVSVVDLVVKHPELFSEKTDSTLLTLKYAREKLPAGYQVVRRNAIPHSLALYAPGDSPSDFTFSDQVKLLAHEKEWVASPALMIFALVEQLLAGDTTFLENTYVRTSLVLGVNTPTPERIIVGNNGEGKIVVSTWTDRFTPHNVSIAVASH